MTKYAVTATIELGEWDDLGFTSKGVFVEKTVEFEAKSDRGAKSKVHYLGFGVSGIWVKLVLLNVETGKQYIATDFEHGKSNWK